MIVAVASHITCARCRIPAQLTAATRDNVRRKVDEPRAARIPGRVRALTVNAIMTLGANRYAWSRARRINIGGCGLAADIRHVPTVQTKISCRATTAAARERRFGVTLKAQGKIRRRIIFARRFQNAIAIIIHQDICKTTRLRRESRVRRRRRRLVREPIIAVTIFASHHRADREIPKFVRQRARETCGHCRRIIFSGGLDRMERRIPRIELDGFVEHFVRWFGVRQKRCIRRVTFVT